MKTTAKNFLALLEMNGHDGDKMCLATIEEKLAKGVQSAVTHYSKYLAKAEVKKLTPAQITEAVKNGKCVWTSEGIITKSKMNVPQMNGVLLLNENMITLSKNLVIVF